MDLKLWCDNCINFQVFEGAQYIFIKLRQYVACFYPTTPTYYPNGTRCMCVGPPVAVNIDFCGYVWFFNISLVWIIWVQYATDNHSGQELEFVS